MERDQNVEGGRDRREWQPWLYHFLMAPGIVGCVVISGVAVVYYFEGSCRFFSCIDLVPYSQVPIVLVVSAIVVKWLERLWHRPRS
jgi:hypothetical protein